MIWGTSDRLGCFLRKPKTTNTFFLLAFLGCKDICYASDDVIGDTKSGLAQYLQTGAVITVLLPPPHDPFDTGSTEYDSDGTETLGVILEENRRAPRDTLATVDSVATSHMLDARDLHKLV